MRAKIVKTENTARFLGALQLLDARGAEEACLMVVDGPPGTGKSQCIEHCAVQQNWIFLRAKQGWSRAWMLRDLLESLQVPPAHSYERMYKQAVEALGLRKTQAARQGELLALVIDEADHIVRRVECLEGLRDLTDYLELPVILVGMGRIRSSLSRYPQIASRIAQHVQFEPCSASDTAAMIRGLAEVEVAACLIDYVHAESRGLAREIKEAIARIEEYGRRNEGPVTVQAMAGQVLMYDRTNSQPITVRV